MLINFNAGKARKLYEKGIALYDAGRADEALEILHQSLQHAEASVTCYAIGLIHKYRNEWQESLKYNKRAWQLNPADEAAGWNLAIAATALGDWASARDVWHRLGYGIEPGIDEIRADFGMTPLRLNASGDGEVVWGCRIDPVRARLANIPYPSSGFRYGDVVLHDGAPVGTRIRDGREYPVFNVLERLQPAQECLLEIEAVADNDGIEALEATLNAAGHPVEVWSWTVRALCKACSEGVPHESHDTGQQGHGTAYRIGIAGMSRTEFESLVEQWKRGGRGRYVLSATHYPATASDANEG